MAAGAGTGGSAAPGSRFAAACGALSRYLIAADGHGTRHPRWTPATRPLPLMPGADVNDGGEERRTEAGPAQLTIFYGGRVLVLDDCPADKAAALLRLAAGEGAGRDCGELAAASPLTDLPVARKASLQRFMEKRKGRLAGPARAEPYRRPDAARRD